MILAQDVTFIIFHMTCKDFLSHTLSLSHTHDQLWSD